MRKATTRTLAALTVLVLSVALLAGCSSKPKAAVEVDKPASSKPATTTPKPAASVTHVVKITDSGFSPKKITVKVGDKVIWKNVGSKAHNITLLNTMRTSGSIKAGGEASHVFDIAGPWPYKDSYFPKLEGIVIVK